MSATPRIGLKFSNFDKKGSWEFPAVSRTNSVIRKSVSPDAFVNGDKAVYIHSRIYHGEKNFSYWLSLDIEDPGNHGSVNANLDVAKELLAALDDKGLTKNLSIFLTGSGLRFTWPFLVEQEHKRPFLSWIKKTADIDPSPQTKNTFLRVLGYRGNKRQGKTQDVHVEKLDDIHDLWFMDQSDYLSLVAGKPDFERSMSLLDGILPKQEIPSEWADFFAEWKVWSDLQDSIWKPAYPKRSGVDWQAVYSHLENTGITWREITRGDMWLLKLNFCPSCGRRDASPFVTASGRLKCFHANSCDAGAQNDKGIMGLPPSVWIPGYEGVEIETREDAVFKGLQAARAEMKHNVHGVNGTLFQADPGVGKTTIVLGEMLPLCQPDHAK